MVERQEICRILCISLLFVVCLLAFLVQSSKEIEKFFEGLTSTSLRTYKEYNISHPVYVVCSRETFRANTSFIASLSDYESAVASFDAVFDNDSFVPALAENKLTFSHVDSLVHGRCFKIEVDPSMSMADYVGIGIRREVREATRFYLLDVGQEMCVELGFCPDEFAVAEPWGEVYEFWVAVTKRILPKKYCGFKTLKEEYQCLTRTIALELERKLPCFPPIVAKSLSSLNMPELRDKPDCVTNDEVNATRHAAVEIQYTMMRRANEMCKSACEKWRYRAVEQPYSHATIMALFGSNTWTSMVYFMSLRDSIDVEEEFVVYDVSGILAALGGSLGLFLGFSFFDCGLIVIRMGFKHGRRVLHREKRRRGRTRTVSSTEEEANCDEKKKLQQQED